MKDETKKSLIAIAAGIIPQTIILRTNLIKNLFYLFENLSDTVSQAMSYSVGILILTGALITFFFSRAYRLSKRKAMLNSLITTILFAIIFMEFILEGIAQVMSR